MNMNITHLLKVTAAWTSIVYTVCYVGVWLYPPIRDIFMTAALHASVPVTSGPFTIGSFITGLIIWNIVTLLAVWLFAELFNRIRA